MEAGRCTPSWAGTGKQFEGLSPLGPTFLKKPWKNWPEQEVREQRAATNEEEDKSCYLHSPILVS